MAEKVNRAVTLGRLDAISSRIVPLAKLLSNIDAQRLIAAFALYPEEVGDDLIRIENEIVLTLWKMEGSMYRISELLEWYGDKALCVAAGNTKGLIPKEELAIFKKSRPSKGPVKQEGTHGHAR
ncbi:MAG: hypothetical protein WAP51_02425 [Candidatus Sungiibacteriota bacterium]